jgi:hypothetical protein
MKRRIRTKRTNNRNKYSFSEHLERPGDYIQTLPMSKREAWNIMYAAQMWAYDHMFRVSCARYPAADDKQFVVITLVARDRERDYR